MGQTLETYTQRGYERTLGCGEMLWIRENITGTGNTGTRGDRGHAGDTLETHWRCGNTWREMRVNKRHGHKQRVSGSRDN